ncbi:PREDICTED: NADH dehydrogenase [ubiquinone] 1 alpha subcomplex subunit 9, mitochondrial [Ceratosolen solmsi marchali]|uniref:NADH dehydrogenase [ubiquinone] 1 alpha subcomplex subunit 9, mitochondrial n=1 Tax=Ceratosolen solmsi marchali TaxID=326594 RepID=A0AAJ6YNK9_9HYME|nr:PREDICTED: NADH dehydrogenase [ubiquinone] 1 alpha subcomplex subunit 9, mitochondrial [Ceratosolen solmsi marchali]
MQIRNSSNDIKILKNPTTASLPRGTGGRSSFNGKVCTIFGCTGFLGKYIISPLAKTGTQIIIPHCGNNYEAARLKVNGDLGQIIFLPMDLRDEDVIRNSVKYSNVVINLIGRNWETKNYTYKDVHVDGAARIARICKESGVERLIHFSHLNASPQPKPIFKEGGSKVLKAKYYGEQAVKREFPNVTIIRPSLIYGSGDEFMQAYCYSRWRRVMNNLLLYKMGKECIKMPIHGKDVGIGVAACVEDPNTAGKTYQFVGEHAFILYDLMTWLIKKTNIHHKHINHVVVDSKYFFFYYTYLKILESMPGAPISRLCTECYEMDNTSDTVRPELPMLEDLGIKQANFEAMAEFEIKYYNRFAIQMVANRFNPYLPIPESVNDYNF